jgi:hypothetical protein
MTESHAPEHDELLASLLLGDEFSELDRKALEACPICSDKLSELEGVRTQLDVLGAAERATALAEADASGPAPGEQAAQIALESAMRAPARAHEGRSIGHVWILVGSLAAAGILLFAVLKEPQVEPAEPEHPVFLSSTRIELLSPVGRVREWNMFAWRYDVRPGSSFTIRIWDEDVGAADPVLTVPELDDATWTPTTSDLEKIPNRIRWTVVAVDATGREVESEPASAWLP